MAGARRIPAVVCVPATRESQDCARQTNAPLPNLTRSCDLLVVFRELEHLQAQSARRVRRSP